MKSDNYRTEETTSIQIGWRGTGVEWAGSTPTWIKIREGYLGSEESQTHTRLPSLGFQCQEGKSPQLLAVKTSRD